MTTKLKNAAVSSLRKWKKFLGNLLKVILNKKVMLTSHSAPLLRIGLFHCVRKKDGEITEQPVFLNLADSAQHRRGRTKNFPTVPSLHYHQ